MEDELEETEEIFVELVAGAAVLQSRSQELFDKFFNIVSTLNNHGGLKSRETAQPKVQTQVPTSEEVTASIKSR